MEIAKAHEWRMVMTEKGEIIVEHLGTPRFVVQIIIHSGQPEPCVSFKSKWTDQEPQTGEMDWYMKALEFYNHAPKPD